MAGVHGVQFFFKTFNYAVFEDGCFSADVAGLERMADGFLGLSSKARLLIANGMVTKAKLDRPYQEAFLASWIDMQDFFHNTDEIAPTDVTVNDDDAKSFPDGNDTVETKVFFKIPQLYDGAGSVTYTLGISPSTSEANTFSIAVEYSINGGPVTIAGTTLVTPSATADTQTESATVLTLTSGQVSPGDTIMVKIKRLGATDTHSGAMRLYDVRQASPV